MYYVIQENLMREYNFNNLTTFLTRYGLEYEVVRYRPFTDPVVKTDREDVWIFGGFNMGFKLSDRKWKPGLIYDAEKFNFDVYLEKYGNNLLNSDGRTQEFGFIVPWEREEYFIRPTHDTKTFESEIYTESQWDTYVKETIANDTAKDVRKQTKVFYSSPKGPIQQEIRCWVIDGKMVTCSQYKLGRKVNMLNLDNAGDIPLYIRDMCKLYTPARAFCMDICLYEDEYRIVELGCMHHCGFYDADMSKLIQSLENTFGHGLSTGVSATNAARAGKSS